MMRKTDVVVIVINAHRQRVRSELYDTRNQPKLIRSSADDTCTTSPRVPILAGRSRFSRFFSPASPAEINDGAETRYRC